MLALLQAVEPGLQLGGLPGLVVALVRQGIGAGDVLLEPIGGLGQDQVPGLDARPGGIPLGAALPHLRQGDGPVGRPVLAACQRQPALLGPAIPEIIRQLGGGGRQGGAPLQQVGDLRGGGERQAAQAFQAGMPLPQGQQGPVQVTGQALHLDVQLLLLATGIAQVAGRRQGLGQGRRGLGDGQIGQVGIDPLELALARADRLLGAGEGLGQGLLTPQQVPDGRAHQPARQALHQGGLLLVRPAQLPGAVLDLLPQHPDLLQPPADIPLVVAQALALFDEGLDLGGTFQDGRVRVQGIPPRRQVRHLRLVELQRLAGQGDLPFGLGQLGAGLLRQGRDRAEGRQPRLPVPEVGQGRGDAPHPLQAVAFLLQDLASGARLLQVRL